MLTALVTMVAAPSAGATMAPVGLEVSLLVRIREPDKPHPRVTTTPPDSARTAVLPDSLPESPPSPAAIRLAAQLGPHDAVRVIGGFGRFQGFARTAGPGGLERLVAEPDAPHDWRLDPLPERIPWSAIDEVQQRRGNAGRSAAIGAVTLGVLGALSALSVNSYLGSDAEHSTADAVLIAGTFSALVGAAVGAGIGSASRHWAVVYHRQ
jgi:hypothetical protein